MKYAAALIIAAFVPVAVARTAERPMLWRDPGPIQSLDFTGGPGGAANAPKTPFAFVSEELQGISPKVVVTDAKGRKWMVKFGEEAKPDTFASRIAWAAGYVVRPSYYVSTGQISGVPALRRAGKFIDASGVFQGARFQMFDTESFHAVRGATLDLEDKGFDTRELNGLKLTALLVGNWDVKPANTAVFEVGGRRYATITDWGASLGDPNAADARDRKWSCAAYDARTTHLLDGIENGYVEFNYQQYASRGVHALSSGIRVEDMKAFVDRMGKVTVNQLRAGLLASGATADEAACFAAAIRRRLDLFAAAANGSVSETHTVTTITTTTTTTTTTK